MVSSLTVLWHVISIMIGAYALTYVVSPRAESELTSPNGSAAGSDSPHGYIFFPLLPAIILFNLALIWAFILCMLPEWSILSYKNIRIAVTVVWVAISGTWLFLGVFTYGIWGL